MYTLVLIRHGQSQWNKENRFTGWTDVDLTEQGAKEARQAGELIKAEGLSFDVAYTSYLKRAIRTLWHVLDVTDQMWLPVERHWRLNERHYGALQGLNKAETAAEHGEEQVHIWRRSYTTPPPALALDDPRHPSHEARYAALSAEDLPASECLADNVARTIPYWESTIAPQLKAGKKVLVVAHGNSLRSLVKHLEGISDDDIIGLNIPTGAPRLYTLDADLKPIEVRYLGDADEVAARAAAVAAQGKAH